MGPLGSRYLVFEVKNLEKCIFEKCMNLSCIASFLVSIYNKRVLRYKKLRTKYTEVDRTTFTTAL